MGDNNDAIIASGINAAGQVSSASIAAGQNNKARKFAREMYDIQRKDALADWQMQNEYNSPGQQMARLTAAGLNANLVYGNGTVANNSSAPRSSDFKQPDINPIRFDTGSIVNQYYDVKMRQAQTDNLEAQNRVIEQDAALRAAQTAAVTAGISKTGIDTETSSFNLDQAKRLADTSVATAEANLRKINVDTDYTLSQNERATALAQNTISQGAEAILRSRSDRATSEVQRRQLEDQIQGIRKDNTLKDLDITLRRMGINPNDPMYARILGRIVGDPTKLAEKVKERVSEGPQTAEDFLKNNKKFQEHLKNKKK